MYLIKIGKKEIWRIGIIFIFKKCTSLMIQVTHALNSTFQPLCGFLSSVSVKQSELTSLWSVKGSEYDTRNESLLLDPYFLGTLKCICSSLKSKWLSAQWSDVCQGQRSQDIYSGLAYWKSRGRLNWLLKSRMSTSKDGENGTNSIHNWYCEHCWTQDFTMRTNLELFCKLNMG